MRRTPRAGRATRCWTSGWAGRSARPSPWSAASATRRTASTRCTSAAPPPTSVRRARRMSRCAWRSAQRRDAMHAKRWLFLIHRWLGVVRCAFFAMWFVAGVVMMYVGYPKLTEAERLQHLPPLDASAPLLGQRQALNAAGIAGPLSELRLAAASGARAVYLALPARKAEAGRRR